MSYWKVVAMSREMILGFLASGGEKFTLGPVRRLDLSELLCNKVLLKYKRDRESFWHRHQKGAERVPPASLWKWKWKWKWSRSVVSDSLRPHGLYPIRLLHPWDFPGKSAGVDCHFLLQGIFPTQESNPGLPHCRQMLYSLSHQGSYRVLGAI